MAKGNEDGCEAVHLRRNRELFNYLISTFKGLLPEEEKVKFARLAAELNQAVADNCAACQTVARAEAEPSRVGVVSKPSGAGFRDPRRQRFLLRLISARISHLFAGDKAILPKSVVEGMDRYMTKALGDIVYAELNREAEMLLEKLATDDDKQIWERIYESPDSRRFAETILIRILLKFENFQAAKRIFMSIVGMAMNEGSQFQMKDGHFHILFEGMFGDIAQNLRSESQRIVWDYQFGEETGKKLTVIFKMAKQDRAPPKVAARR